jgi:electron transfer flavoprotein beta subunit
VKIAVCVKEVLDSRLPLQVAPASGDVWGTGADPVTLINPADRAALEIAVGIRAEHPGTRVEVYSVCEPRQEGALRYALARGADSVERLMPEAGNSVPPVTAFLLAERFRAEEFDLICCGDETLDNASAAVGPILAELLDLPQATGIVRLREWSKEKLLVERGLERGDRELVEIPIPAVLTLKPDAAEPRYVSVRRLEHASTLPIPVWHKNGAEPRAGLPRWAPSEKRVPPRARVKKKFAPDVNLPAAERVKLIMSGGIAARPSQDASVLEGDPDYLSEQLFKFLKHHELI